MQFLWLYVVIDDLHDVLVLQLMPEFRRDWYVDIEKDAEDAKLMRIEISNNIYEMLVMCYSQYQSNKPAYIFDMSYQQGQPFSQLP